MKDCIIIEKGGTPMYKINFDDDVEIIFIINESKLSMNKELFGKGE